MTGLNVRMIKTIISSQLIPLFLTTLFVTTAICQTEIRREQQRVRTVSIPISIFTKLHRGVDD